MSIISLQFFIFLIAVNLIYWICPSRFRWIILLFASYFFIWYAISDQPYLIIVFTAETLLVWGSALLLKREISEKTKSLLVACNVTVLLLLLAAYKDAFFFTNNFNKLSRLFSWGKTLNAPNWAAPLGISYYSLILIGYLLDVRWGTVEEPQRNPLRLLLFAGYFPQMTSGPFSRYNDISTALFGEVKWSLKQTEYGLQRMLWGLFKKLVLAERLAVMTATLYDSQTAPLTENIYVGTAVIIGAFLYALQLYTDFSGCIDIVIGASELFGIPLAENFRQPFFSTSVSEIWRRWHMTLGFWLKDYLLYPTLKSKWMAGFRAFCKKRFGKKAAKDLPTYLGMLILWFCIGFWHGGTWKYIFGSGIVFFLIIVGGMVLKPTAMKVISFLRIDTDAWSWKFFQRCRSFCLFSFGVSFQRRDSLISGFRAWKTVFTGWNPWLLFNDTFLKLGLNRKNVDICILGLVVVLIVSMLQEKHGSVRKLISEQNLVFRWCIYLSLLFSVLILGRYGPGYDPSAFIYGGF